MTRKQVLELLHKNMQSVNLRRHSLAVEAVMRALAKRLDGNVDTWGMAGLLHDADYELTKNNPKEHTHLTVKWLDDVGGDQEVKNAILAHGWGFVEGNPEPKTSMEWALYTCDELTGFIVAVTLVRPEKNLEAVTVENILKKWPEKSFAAGVHREQIELCEEKLGIPLRKFVTILLEAMQGISKELGL